MNPKQLIKDYFTFSRRELNGIIILLSILTTLIIFNRMMPLIASTNDPSIEFHNEIQVFLQEQKKIKDSIAYADSLRKAKYSQKYKYYNVAKSKSLNETIKGNKPTLSSVASTKEVELNSADTASLISIHGIGPVFASRILKYRKLLGGYYKKEQLLEVYGIDSLVYINIEKQITLDTSLIKKIKVNTAEFKELLKHPYLKYEDVKAIFKLKKGKKKISQEKLDKVQLTNEMILKYLVFE